MTTSFHTPGYAKSERSVKSGYGRVHVKVDLRGHAYYLFSKQPSTPWLDNGGVQEAFHESSYHHRFGSARHTGLRRPKSSVILCCKLNGRACDERGRIIDSSTRGHGKPHAGDGYRVLGRLAVIRPRLRFCNKGHISETVILCRSLVSELRFQDAFFSIVLTVV